MGKEPRDDPRPGSNSMLVGFIWSCADVKLLLTSLLFLCTLATLIQLLPSLTGILSSSDLRSCLSSKISSFPSPLLPPPPPPPHAPTTTALPLKHDDIDSAGVIKREFNPVGSAAYTFIQMGAYRGGDGAFAVVGLASKPLHVFSKPQFTCEWIPHNTTLPPSVSTNSYKILPDWGYGRVYTVVVVHCSFPSPVGTDGSGGTLVLHTTTSGDQAINTELKIVSLEEKPKSVNFSIYTSPPKYEYLYCGSSLYGDLSPQRVREWLAYHAKLFGERGHFVFHDAGGVHPEVMEVLRPWIEKGVVTLQDITEQERFDGYYHNQFLVVNDCLHRHRFAAKWIFFFDVDEFIFVDPRTTLDALMQSLSRYTQFTIEQMPISGRICLAADAGKTGRMWGLEKLVYRDVKRGVRRDRKYAVQPRSTYATGVHMSQNIAGRTLHRTERRMVYYHYHGTIAERGEPCKEFANYTDVKVGGVPYYRDDSMRKLAGGVKKFELEAIGARLRNTRQ